MALTVEDGSIVEDAESYVTVEVADAFMSARNREDWEDYEESEKEVFLRMACEQMEARYRTLWKGLKRNDNSAVSPQPLSWPRKSVTDEDGVSLSSAVIPTLVKKAQMEIAWVLAQGSEFIRSEIDPEEGRVSSEKIGPLTTTYFKSVPLSSTFPYIDQMLEPLTGGVASVKLGANISLTDSERREIERDNPDHWDLTDPRWSDYFTSVDD